MNTTEVIVNESVRFALSLIQEDEGRPIRTIIESLNDFMLCYEEAEHETQAQCYRLLCSLHNLDELLAMLAGTKDYRTSSYCPIDERR